MCTVYPSGFIAYFISFRKVEVHFHVKKKYVNFEIEKFKLRDTQAKKISYSRMIGYSDCDGHIRSTETMSTQLMNLTINSG